MVNINIKKGNTVVTKMLGRYPKQRLSPLGDRDKDGVANMIDCAPRNPNKQGPIHDYAKKKWQEYKEERERRNEERKETREIERTAYHEESKKVAAERGKVRARQPSLGSRVVSETMKVMTVVGKSGATQPKRIRVKRHIRGKKKRKDIKTKRKDIKISAPKKEGRQRMPNLGDFKLF